ncbi:glycosyltransferase family 4 protein [Methylovirgula sp. 4M-Z18]|uniref:glycosyltransferase family 4 protein n=1 Tax=Methylovirgula sp. 4M-Z18 TaxID=2293567 RepID=UPI000E2F2388|nr:glycosyltransferase family 4 protein [Methylovirgula sp. 4M-Z18]RFB79141.1 glycosyltransferase [Methylovirgula sp. 4M-Z18]
MLAALASGAIPPVSSFDLAHDPEPSRPATLSVADVRATLAGRTILQIIPALDAGGAERTTVDMAAALAEVGARALVASTGGRLVSELQAKGGTWLPFPAKSKNPIAMALNVRKLMHLIRQEGVDILHARSRAPAWVALGAVRRTGTPFVTTYHGAYSGKSSLKLRYNSVMARGDAVIANSAYTASLIARNYPQAAARTVIIHRGTDFRAFRPTAVDPQRVANLRKAWGAEGERIVLLPGRLTGWKGQRVLIAAAEQLMRQGLSGVHFILAGDEQGRTGYAKELDQLIAKGGLTGIVKRIGHCADMPAAYMAAAVVVVPSTEPEAFGRTSAEAQAMGVPVVVSDLGAMPETVLAPPEVPDEQRTGWRVPPGDATALAEAIQRALGLGASMREAMAYRARIHVESLFSLEQMCASTLEVYARLLQNKSK